MVVDQASDAGVDRIFHALADGTRRDILAPRPGISMTSRSCGGRGSTGSATS
jgi:DNA-binding transcriptional ArsR family regulator